MKKKSFTLQTPENKVGRWAKFLEWNRKWNKIMACVFGVLFFVLLFAVVVVNTTTTTTTTSGKKSNTRNGRSAEADFPSCEFFPTKTSRGNMCDILCSCILPDLLSALVEAAIENDDTECKSVGYHLRYDEPQISAIAPGWLKTSAIINKLTIVDTGQRGLLTDIEPGAFDDCAFREMTELVIRSTVVSVLRKGVFEGASSLKKLSMEENGSMRMIEASTLDPLYQLEQIKMTRNPQFVSLFNLTGYNQLKHVRTLTLNFNNFSASIDAETFKGCISVESINLSNSSIETIGIGTFDHMAETIQYLDLRDNKLKHLPSGLLTPLFRLDVRIYLSNNLWHCDCNSLELQSWAINDSGIIADCPLLCDMPEMDRGRNLINVDLGSCETPTTEPSDKTTDEISDTSTTFRPPFSEPLTCINPKYTSGTLYLGNIYQYFNVKQVEMGTVSIEMISPPDASLSMVVINDKDDIECRYDVNRQMTFSNLDANAAHLFCLIKKTSEATSPRNCYPFQFADTKSIWSYDEIIIALICSIVLSLVVGLLCGWLLRSRYQRVFRARESLQYRTSARSTSKTATEIEDFNSSITSDYFAGRYGSVKGANAKRLRRTFSDNSIASCKSYITAVTPSPFEIIQWKLRKNAIHANDLYLRDYLDKVEYDCLPPPLPPHPNRRNSEKIYETIAGEPVYLCTSEIDPYKITYASN